MRNATGNERGNIRIGHGSFVDKTVMPFVSTVPSKLKNPCDEANPCEPPYTFRNNLALDEDLQNFQDALEKIESSSNLDAPEAGLDAMMQGNLMITNVLIPTDMILSLIFILSKIIWYVQV